jgi:hypothetical protein
MTTRLEEFKEKRPDAYYDKVKNPLDTGLGSLYPSTWLVKLLQTLGVAPDWDEEEKLKTLLEAEEAAKQEWMTDYDNQFGLQSYEEWDSANNRGLKGNRDIDGSLISK